MRDDLAGSVAPTRVWLLLGHKSGDNNQVLALAERLGWGFEEKRIAYRPWELLANRILGVTLAGVDPERSSALEAPWPDLVISSGRRNEPVARGIQPRSGGHARLVHIGRPWADPGCFDLVIATPQYPIGRFPNVLMNAMPMHRLNEALLAEAARRWGEALGRLTGPRIAVLLGGNSGAYVYTPAKGARLGRLVNGLARSVNGSVMVSDSARTPPGVLDALLAEIDVPLHCHRWAGAGGPNPYLAYLALAEQFVVTADSVSMVAAAEYTGRPVWLFDPDDGPDWWRRGYNYRFDALVHRAAMTIGPRRMRRDVRGMLDALVAEGRAAWLGGRMPRPVAERGDDTLRAALAVAGLFSRRG
ncbi:MAG: mitochondrial fission ELM1 family protein [Gammaproteobacteria bacterium]